jgi:RNA polymerase sigma factor
VILLDLEINRNILLVQQGKEETREELIKKYLPFILKVTARTCKRYVYLEDDDEVSVALSAFNEALDKYDLQQKASFFTFAELVIRNRLIDYFRQAQQGVRDVPWSSLRREGEEDGDITGQIDKLTWQESVEQHYEQETAEMRREEIREYSEKLKEFGIEFKDLVKDSPKHQDARITAYQIARLICEEEGYCSYLQKTKTLPLKDLEKEVQVSRKTLERRRKYIIALVIIMLGKFYFLQDYLEGMKG